MIAATESEKTTAIGLPVLVNSKSQIPKNKQIPMTKITNLFRSLKVGIWNFIGIWCL